jgi:aspartate/methionine/tyrosine aminotransferase
MESLVDVAEEHDGVLVSHEVYDHYAFTGEFGSALATDSDPVVATNSFSKSMAITGFRVGYAVLLRKTARWANSSNGRALAT